METIEAIQKKYMGRGILCGKPAEILQVNT